MRLAIFALTSRGLEAVAAGEMAAMAEVQVHNVAYRRVAGVCMGRVPALLDLRTVDDVFLDVAAWSGIAAQREGLARLRELSAELDLRDAAATCAGVRTLRRPLRFSVTVSFVGRRSYSTAEIKRACAEEIVASHGWPYAPNDAHADLNVRLFIEHDHAYVGVRLGATPLHRRAYKRAHVPGSLKPPVAAAMLSLVDVGPGQRVVDPCCGAGTLPIEAAAHGAASVWAGDVDAGALDAARTNVRAAGAPVSVHRWDAQALPLADAGVDRVVCNPPWGRAVAVGMDLALFYRRLCAEIRRVLAPGGRVALLTSVPELVHLPALQCDAQFEISLFGQTPSVLLYSLAGA
jgi:23S rRNA G2445 N2-methylase RlmL